MQNKQLILFLLILNFFPLSVKSNMAMDKIILNFYSNKMTREDVGITNTGEDTLYLSAKVFEIINPESESPQRIELNDPRKAGLIISPNRMVIAPGQNKIVRVIPTSPATDKDKVYRILIKPHAQKMSGQGEGKSAGFKIMIGYELLVFIRPADYTVDLEVKREGTALNLFNAGNTNINVREIKLCGDDKSECTEIGGNRLYAGQSMQVILPSAKGKILIRKSVGSKFTLDEY
jgi:P pilus assembly chaperone PapD